MNKLVLPNIKITFEQEVIEEKEIIQEKNIDVYTIEEIIDNDDLIVLEVDGKKYL